ncbi:MAG: putative nucleotidyltransferase substrate binding domain-containing protein, partial [bacterium]
PCSADSMASNPTWCQPLSVWKSYFKTWIRTPTPEAILQSLIFFDFRGVHGNVLLAEHLRTFLNHEIKDNELFLAHMAAVVLKNSPPLDILGRFGLEKKGPHKGEFNLKINGLCPVIDLARLSALEFRIYETSTVARLMASEIRDTAVGPLARDLAQVFELLMSLRLRHQFQQSEKGLQLDNFISPQTVGLMDQRLLREAFKLIVATQKSFSRKYSAWLIR